MALGLLALLGLYAGKNGIMDVTKDGGAFQMFQEYAQLVGGWWLTKCEEREQGLRLSVLGKLFVRLYHPRARGRGFQAPANAKAFKLYVFKANRGAALSVLNRLPELPGESVMEEEREDDHNRKKKVRPRPRRTGADPSTSVEERPDASR